MRNYMHHKKPYPSCPVCHKSTFIWHRYDTYLHFKCGDKSCNFSFKLPILPPEQLLVSDELSGRFSFKRFRHPPHLIFLTLTLYFDGYSSTRSIQRFFLNAYDISISHVTIHSWTKIFAPWFQFVSNNFLPLLDFASDEWHADETYVKIKGIDYFLWILLDSETRCVLSFVLSPYRDSNQAFRLFYRARELIPASPNTIVTDGWASYNEAIKNLYPSARHHKYSAFTDDLNNNFIESFNKTFKAWYKTKKGFGNFHSALALITTFIFSYNFIHQHSSLSNLSPAQVAGAVYSNMEQKHWLLS